MDAHLDRLISGVADGMKTARNNPRSTSADPRKIGTSPSGNLLHIVWWTGRGRDDDEASASDETTEDRAARSIVLDLLSHRS